MIGYFLKKSFYDGWDNLLSLAVYNIVLTFFMVAGYYLIGKLTSYDFLVLVIFVLLCCIFMILVFAVNEVMGPIADFKSVSFMDVVRSVPSVIKDALLFGLVTAALILLAFIGIPFYLSMKSMIGVFLAAIVFWVLVIGVLSLQWFLPIRCQLKNSFTKCFKKSFLIFFDNTGFSIFMFFYNLILLALSLPLAFIIPGVSGILLALNNAFRLRMYKYDWIEEHPELTVQEARKQIPWEDLIEEDRETTGHRTFRNFIFPWKD